MQQWANNGELTDEPLEAAATNDTGPDGGIDCEICFKRSAAFDIGAAQRCLFCTLRYRPLLKRSGLTALFVGTVLTVINQGNLLVAGELSMALLWKVPLTYCVPFFVATWGALINSRLTVKPTAN